jgi:hypothetical protein
MRVRGFQVFCCLLASVLLAGCATAPQTNSNDPLAQADAHFTAVDQAKENVAPTVATGAAVGCIAGALLGAFLDSGNRAAGAAMGCGGGGLAGTAGGYAVAKNNVAEAGTEAALNADIAKANQDARVAQQAAAEAWRQTYAAKAETMALQGEVRAGQITEADYRTRISSYERSSEEMKSLINDIDQREAVYRASAADAPPEQAQELGAATQQLDAARANLTNSYDAMQQALGARPGA